MTQVDLVKRCAAFALVVPCTVEDCGEIFAELKPHVPPGDPLDVMMIDDHTIRVMVGVKPNERTTMITA